MCYRLYSQVNPMTQGLDVRELKFSALSASLNNINGATMSRCQKVTTILSRAAAGEIYQVLGA